MQGDQQGHLRIINGTHMQVHPAHTKAVSNIKIIGDSIFTFSQGSEDGIKKWQYSESEGLQQINSATINRLKLR